MPNFNRLRRARAGYPARLAGLGTVLNALTISSAALPVNSNSGVVIGALQGASGSTFQLIDSHSNSVALASGGQVVVGTAPPSAVGTFAATFAEINANATNSGRQTTLTFTVIAAGSGAVYDFVGDTANVNGTVTSSTANLTSSTRIPVSRSGSGLYVQPNFGGSNVIEVGSSSFYVPTVLDGSWSVFHGSKTAGQPGLASDTDALLVTEDTTASTVHWLGSGYYNFSSTQSYSFTYNVKPNGRTICWLGFSTANNGSGIYFNLTGAGTVGPITGNMLSGEILPLANGWYRITAFTKPGLASSNDQVILALAPSTSTINYTGDGVSGMYVCGLQPRGALVTAPVPSNSNGTATFTFDDNSTQTIAVVPGTYVSFYGINRPLVKSLSMPAGTWTPSGPERCVGAGGRIPLIVSGVQNNSTPRRILNRGRLWVGAGGADYLQFCYVGYYYAQAPGRTNFVAAQPLELAVEFPDAPNGRKTCQITFGGQPVGSIPVGSGEYRCDPILPSYFGWTKFPANVRYWFRTARQVPANGAISWSFTTFSTTYSGDSTGGYDCCGMDTTVGIGQMLSTGVSENGAGANYGIMYPACIIGRTSTPVPAVLHGGDSISYAGEDPTGDGQNGGGYFARAAYNYDGNGGHLPHSIMSLAGSNGASFTTLGSAYAGIGVELYKYFQYSFNNHIHNTIAGDPSVEDAKPIIKAIWNQLKTAAGSTITNVRHYAMIVETSGSSAYDTAAHQTPSNTYNTDRPIFNSWLNSEIGHDYLDGVIDLNPAIEDTSVAGGVWKSPGYTSDGTHPTVLANVAMATLLQPTLAALT